MTGLLELAALGAVCVVSCWGAWRWGGRVSVWIGEPEARALLRSLREDR